MTRNTQISSQDFVNIQDHVYSLDLVATNIDLTKDSAQSYGSLPENMKSSISSFDLKKIAPSLSITQTRMNLLVKPNQTNETVLKVENIGYGPLSFTTTISGNGLSIIPGKNDILSSKDTRDIHISGTCTNVDLIGTLTIKSNDPSNNTKSVPVILECDTPVSATLELQKLTHRYGIQSMQYSPDGKKIATTDSTEVIVWDALTGAVLHRFGASSNDVIKNSVYSLAWHSNSRSILVGMGNGIIVLDTETGLGGISVNLPSIAFSVDWNSDSSKFVVGVSGAAKIYNSTTGLLDLQISVPDGSSPSVNWSKSSNRLATAFSGKVYVWDTLTGLEINHYNALISKFDNYSSNALYSVSWNPTGDKLALFSNGSPMLISIWQINASNAELQIPITTNDPIGSINSARDTVWDIKWSPVNSEIAVILRKDLVGDGWRFINQIWDASNGALKTEFYTKSLSEQVTSSLAWSPDGSTILTQNIRSAFGWHVLNNENFLQLGFASGKISAMKMNSDASKLVISTIPDYSIGNLNLINIPSGSFLSSITVPRSVIALDWRKNTEEILGVLINTSGNNIVNSFDSTSGSVLNSYGGDFASVFSPDGQKIATMVDKSQVNILDASTKILLKTINLPACVLCTAYPAQAIVWSPDGKKIAVRIIDGVKIDVFDILSGSLIWERDLTQDGSVFQGNSIDRPTFLWSPDGKLISSGSAFFNALTGENFPLFERKFVVGGPIVGSIPMPLAWSADSRYLLTQDSTRIELRNATSGRIVTSIREIPNVNVSIVKADWNIQTNRFAFTDAQFSVYVYKFSQP